MRQEESKAQTHQRKHTGRDAEICNECIDLMKTTADKCRAWSKETSSSTCKGGLSTSAFVCESLASAMEACMKEMNKKNN